MRHTTDPATSASWILIARDACVGALTLFLLIGVRYFEPPWMQDRALLVLGGAAAAAYTIGLVALRRGVLAPSGLLEHMVRVAAAGSIVCLPILAMVLLGDLPVQQLTLLIEIALVYFLLAVNALPLPRWTGFGVTLCLLLVGIAAGFTAPARAAAAALMRPGSTDAAGEERFLLTSLHDVQVISSRVVPVEETPGADIGGAIEVLSDSSLLFADAYGTYYHIVIGPDGATPNVLRNLRGPINRAEYVRDVENPSLYFRTTDILLVDDGRERRRTLYVAHHTWDASRRCFSLVLSEGELDLDALDRGLEWRTRYSTMPCLEPSEGPGNATGGRLSLLGTDQLLLTVGLTRLREESIPTEPYGQILIIDRQSWNVAPYTTGHRNPQGLLVTDGSIWETEHGPDGGDELNLVLAGRDYGWPWSSFGVHYGSKTLPDSAAPGGHLVGELPVFAWVPSIGVSQLIRVRGTAFSSWAGDLLIGSLGGRGHGRAVFRARVRDGRVRVIEPIRLGVRVRDLVETPRGDIVIWDGIHSVHILRPAGHVFAACTGCHAVNRSFPANGVGPDLREVVNRRAGTVRGFPYSEPMKALGARWTPARLDWFLRDPAAAVPGTTMEMPGVADPSVRRAIIQYLIEAGRQ